MAIDTLSDVLRTVRLTGAVFFDVDCSSPWAEASPRGDLIRSRVLPGVEHLISYHMITEGDCWGGVTDQPPLRLAAGDIIIFPHGDPHILSSEPGTKAVPDMNNYTPPARSQLPLTVNSGGGGSRTHLVCGFLGCDVRPFNPLITALPRVLHISDRSGSHPGWLSQLIQAAAAESRLKRTGGEAVLGRLSELMFVEAMRCHLETIPEGDRGWLAGLKDPAIGRVLALIHSRPAHPWTLEDLGREGGVSRSVLAERFLFLVGQPPFQYLTQWRMQMAASLLANGDRVGSVALDVGYDSEAAFSRAFKKSLGMPPASWRERREDTAAAKRGRTPRDTRGQPPSLRRSSVRAS